MSESRRPEVVVVTGASAGVGRTVVRMLAERGARIGLIARGICRSDASRVPAAYLRRRGA